MSSHVVTEPRAPFKTASGRLEVHQIPAACDNLVWLLVDPRTQTAAAVDGPGAREALAYCQRHHLSLTTIMNTHVHGDHVGINRDLARRGLLADMTVYGAQRTAAQIPGLTHPLSDGDPLVFGDVPGRVMLTEGHLDGHLSFLFEDVLFCGDTLFTAGCGFLADGPPETMWRSLATLAALPDATLVCCAHEYTLDNLRFARSVEPHNPALMQRLLATQALRAGGGCAVPSTLAEERATNPFLRWDSPELIARVRAVLPDRPFDTPAQVFAATRALKDTGRYRSPRREPSP